ncbi:MAG: hypothetical protein U0269_30605 [Polyangiales bacterium]
MSARQTLRRAALYNAIRSLARSMGTARVAPVVGSIETALQQLALGVLAAMTLELGERAATVAFGGLFVRALEELPLDAQQHVLEQLGITNGDAICERQRARALQARIDALTARVRRAEGVRNRGPDAPIPFTLTELGWRAVP